MKTTNKIPIEQATHTVSGLEVEIYTTNARFANPTYIIHGSIQGHGIASWNLNGKINSIEDSRFDLQLEPQSLYKDWPIDAKILVWYGDTPDKKYKRYFAGVDDSGYPVAWEDGATSFSTLNKTSWDCAELFKEDE